MPALTYPEHQKSSLRTGCSPHALLSCACSATSGHETSSCRPRTIQSTSCPRFTSGMALDMTQLCLQFLRPRYLPFRLDRLLSCLPFYSFSFLVFAKGKLTHPCMCRPPSQILLIFRLMELRLMEPSDLAFDLARAESPPAALSQVLSRAA